MKGYVDYGNFEIQNTSEREATNALFVMATEINGNNKTPVQHILTNGCTSELIANLIQQSVKKLEGCSATVLTVTFDGLPANLKSIDLLGGNTDIASEKYQPYVLSPTITDGKIYFTPDPCHMIKLLRNAVEAYGTLLDENGNVRPFLT